MTSEQIGSLLEGQRKYYKSGVTIPVDFRIRQLKKLYKTVKKYEEEVTEALQTDLGKSHYEGFMCESGLVLSEISYMIRHTKKFARRKSVYTPLTNFPAHIMARTDLMPFRIINLLWIKRPGLICRCVISLIKTDCMRSCYTCF
ncbi:MAG: hypothetical protein IKL80_01405 [Clostridia bacterium]|nr:hypothetical protein [Clostridia bacterium]